MSMLQYPRRIELSTLCLLDNSSESNAIRGRVKELIQEILDMVEEIAESEVDSCDLSCPLPGGSVGDRIETLVSHLRLLFTSERDARQVTISSSDAPHFLDATTLDAEHDTLLAQISWVFDLTGSPHCPASTWTDIESSFRRFVAKLVDHEAREDGFLQERVAELASELD
jgi:hypothetical protein